MSRLVESLWYPPQERVGRRWALSPLSLLALAYSAAARARVAMYRTGAWKAESVEGVRVVSVGNLTVGGAGKTPAVIALAARLKSQQQRIAVVTRGYGRETRAPVVLPPGAVGDPKIAGDEPVLISQRTGVPVLVDRDRVRAVQRARDEWGARLVLLDDGFQHLRLQRALDILVVDEAVGFGNGHLFPRGPLREPLSALARAGLIWLRTASRPVPLPEFHVPVVRAHHAPAAWLAPDGEVLPLSAHAGRKVVALCAIARPGSFERTLAEVGVERVATFAFGDHHRFGVHELARVRARAKAEGACIVTTEKDRVRLPAGSDTYALRLEVRISDGEAHLDRLLTGP